MNQAAAVKGMSMFDWLAGMQGFPHRADIIGNFLDYRPGAITDFCGDTCLNRIDLPQPVKLRH
jgi:hypothetical protein